MTQLTKKQLIAKISKEQEVDPKSLERLNVQALLKMDVVVPDTVVADDGDLLGGTPSELPSDNGSDQDGLQAGRDGDVDTSGDSGKGSADSGSAVSTQEGAEPINSEPPQEPTPPKKDVVVDAPTPVPNRWAGSRPVVLKDDEIGFHPMTGKPVKMSEQ